MPTSSFTGVSLPGVPLENTRRPVRRLASRAALAARRGPRDAPLGQAHPPWEAVEDGARLADDALDHLARARKVVDQADALAGHHRVVFGVALLERSDVDVTGSGPLDERRQNRGPGRRVFTRERVGERPCPEAGEDVRHGGRAALAL